jgi:hypothetical protein
VARRDKRRRTRRKPPAGPLGATTVATEKAAYPGARVARVAVDDDTWAAFRVLCEPTPASVRLGDLVREEVARANGRHDPLAEALSALRVIGDQTEALEAYVRRLSSARGAHE